VWTWPYAPETPEHSGVGLIVEGVTYLAFIAVFAIPAVQDATGIAPLEMTAIMAVHCAWMLFARFVLDRRATTSRRAFDAMVLGDVTIGTVLSTAIVVVGGAPGSVLWGPLVLYATHNGGIREFRPSIVLQLFHVGVPLASIPVFLAQDAGEWSVAGPVLAATFAAVGYHLRAMSTAAARVRREAIEARLAHAERVASELRLARDLHDVVGSTLGTVKLYADMLASSTPGIATPLSDVAQAGLDDLRAVLDALAPPGAGGLSSTLAAIARRTSPSGLEVRIRGEWPEDVPGVVRVAAARIAQEAIHNAIRHARASSIDIGCRADHGLVLTVRDDGCGFEPAVATASGAGRGLGTMAARVAELGGTLAIESSVGGGTEIVATFPSADHTRQHAA